MAKRFVVPFIIAVLVLIVLAQFLRSVQDSLYWSYLVALAGKPGDTTPMPLPFIQPKSPPRELMVQRYLNDWRVQHVWADIVADAKEAVACYDKIIARFPDKPALYAGRVLRYAQFTSFERPEEYRLTGDKIPARPSKPLPNPSDLERAIAAVREGMKVEPDNAFFNYAMASYLFGLRRDEEAFAQMAEATRKPRYDSHIRDAGLNRIHLADLLHAAPLSRLTIWATTLFPHCAKERQVARLVTWFGKEAEQKGDHALALERYSQVMRMGEHIMDGSSSLIEALVGAAIESVGLNRGIKRNRTTPPGLTPEEGRKRSSRMMRQYAQEFADYAIAHGRDDLASAAWRGFEKAQEAKELAAYFVGQDRERFRNAEEPYADLTRYLRVTVGQSALVIQAGLALLMALITALLAWRFREKQQVSWLTAFCVAMVCWLPAAVLLYVNCQRVPNPLGWQSESGSFSPAMWMVAILLPFVLEDIGWGARVVWMRLRPKGAWRFDSPPLLPRTCVMLALLSLATYVVLLVPLKRAEKEANAHIAKIAAGKHNWRGRR